MALKLRLEVWGRSLVGQFGGDFPDGLRGEGKLVNSDKWSVFSLGAPQLVKSSRAIYLPGTGIIDDDSIFSAKFGTAEEAAEAKVEIINSLRTWENFFCIRKHKEEEPNVYIFGG